MRVVGVDFSGARDAGNRIWVATGTARENGVVVETCVRCRDLPGSGADKDRALAALVDFIAGAGGCTVGLDFPFSLPAALVEEPGWEEFVRAFASRYPTADELRRSCMARTGGKELRRRTDREARVPFCVYNMRLYRQTHAGIRDVLAPLIADGTARVLPMQPPDPSRPALAETCPASLLKAIGVYPSYKGRDGPRREARARILSALAERRLLRPPPRALADLLVDDNGGDALDAVIAAVCAARAAREPTAARARDALEQIEARVFF